MKNLLSALALFAFVGVLAVAAVFIYPYAFKSDKPRELTPEELAHVIMQKLGKPFETAWADRNANALKDLTRGEFGAGLPTSLEWKTESNPPFQTMRRSCTEEEQDSVTDYETIFGFFLDPIHGLKNLQTEFSILEASDYSTKNEDMWLCVVLLKTTGADEEGNIMTYTSEQNVIVTMPIADTPIPTALRYWEVREETMLKSEEPVMGQIRTLLSKHGLTESDIEAAAFDVADFDADQDMDIAVTLPAGKRFLFAYENQAYVDIGESLGILGDSVPSSGQPSTRTIWMDPNEDGFPDLVSGNRMFKNEKGKRFVDVTEKIDFDQMVGPHEPGLTGRLRRHFRAQE